MLTREEIYDKVTTALVEALVSVDDALTSGRALISQEVRRRTQDRLDELQLGIAVSSVYLLSVDPPSQVIDVLRDVSNAVADRERVINEANGYANSVIPRARGEARWIASGVRMIALSPQRRRRLSFDAMSVVSPRVDKTPLTSTPSEPGLSTSPTASTEDPSTRPMASRRTTRFILP